jgi:hypothetical protein
MGILCAVVFFFFFFADKKDEKKREREEGESKHERGCVAVHETFYTTCAWET